MPVSDAVEAVVRAIAVSAADTAVQPERVVLTNMSNPGTPRTQGLGFRV